MARVPVGRSRPAAAAMWVLATALAPGIVRGADTGSQQVQLQQLRQQLHLFQGQIERLAEQNRSLMQHQQRIEQQLREQQIACQGVRPPAPATPAPATPPPATAATAPAATAPAATTSSMLPDASPSGSAAQPAGPGSSAWGNLHLWGYGEIYYAHPTEVPRRTQADLARAVFGIGYRFDDRTEFNSEYEVEHAVSSAGDAGELEVEQFYVDHRLTDRVALRAGLMLMPFGLLNEHHEPTNFYGVQRNFVETLIIPSTWREGGFGFHGDADFGLTWNAGVTTGLDLSKWKFVSEFPPYTTALELEDSGVAPMQATHQELSLANARNLSQYLAIGYFGIPGLSLGAAIDTGKPAPAIGANGAPARDPSGDPRLTLWEAHARWTAERLELSALYARGTLSQVAAANLANPGSPNPLPGRFDGYFLEAAYALWKRGDYQLNPFLRYEYYNMGSGYSGAAPLIPIGLVPWSSTPGDLGPWPQDRDRVWTLGASLYVTPHVVFKADWQRFQLNRFFDRFDLGLGLNF